MRKHPQLYGLKLFPCSLNQRDHEKTIFSAECAVKSDFRDNYEKRMAEMQIIAESANIFILHNYKKVRNWSDLEISIMDNSGKETFYYNHKETKPRLKNTNSEYWSKRIARYMNRMKRWHNPIRKISDVVLDTTDGDFSIKVNGKWHNWIDKESTIVLADYIEKQIKK